MARRRLTDMLREEAHKPEDADESATPTQPAIAESAEATSQLKTALEQFQQREAALQQQITELQATLDRQLEQIQSFQADLKRADSLKTDLEQAKKDALNLADANTKLTQELEALKAAPAPQAAPLATMQPKPSSPASPDSHPAQSSQERDEMRRRQMRSLSHPVFPTSSAPSQSPSPDVGWMD